MSTNNGNGHRKMSVLTCMMLREQIACLPTVPKAWDVARDVDREMIQGGAFSGIIAELFADKVLQEALDALTEQSDGEPKNPAGEVKFDEVEGEKPTIDA